jgi:vanillate O-demethylase ferredoxin subunit
MIRVRLTQKKAVAEDIAAFELMAIDNSPLPAFSAGAHIDVHLGNGLVRQYSLCNSPEDRLRYVLGVLRVPNSRGGSTGMHLLDEGDTIEISEPRNHFPLAQDAKRSILVAGGIGLTPLLSMAESLSKTPSSFVLHYCVRNVNRAAFRDRLALHDLAPYVRLHFDSDYKERAFEAKSLFAEEIKTGTHVYVCGPGGFIEMVLAAAQAAGFSEAQVHREYFNAEIRDAGAQDKPFTIRIASTGEDIEVGVKQRVIDALAARGVVIPVSCEQGVCGTCLTRVIDGIPEHRDVYLTDLERAGNDQFTPCCSRARSPLLVLDL